MSLARISVLDSDGLRDPHKAATGARAGAIFHIDAASLKAGRHLVYDGHGDVVPFYRWAPQPLLVLLG